MATKVNHQGFQQRLEQINQNYHLDIESARKAKDNSLKCAIFWSVVFVGIFPFSVTLAGNAGVMTAGHLVYAKVKEMDITSLKTKRSAKMIIANRISQEKFDEFSRERSNFQGKCWNSTKCLCGMVMLYGASRIGV